jgi:hypothetical protein
MTGFGDVWKWTRAFLRARRSAFGASRKPSQIAIDKEPTRRDIMTILLLGTVRERYATPLRPMRGGLIGNETYKARKVAARDSASGRSS